MVKFTVWNKDENREVTKFTRELNTYGFDKNGIGEELLFPIRLNKSSGGTQETNLATYLVKFMEFEKTCVKIKNNNDKERFENFSFYIENNLIAILNLLFNYLIRNAP